MVYMLFLSKKNWHIVGEDVVNLVQKKCVTGEFGLSVNQTFFALIPKASNPTTTKEFSPISLCNLVYKIISKVIANRSKFSISGCFYTRKIYWI